MAIYENKFENSIVFNNKLFFKGENDIIHYINEEDQIIEYINEPVYKDGFDNPYIDKYLFFKAKNLSDEIKIFYIDDYNEIKLAEENSYTNFNNPISLDNKIIFDGGNGIYNIEYSFILNHGFDISVDTVNYKSILLDNKTYIYEDDFITDLIDLINSKFLEEGIETYIQAKKGPSSNSIMFVGDKELTYIKLRDYNYISESESESESETEEYNEALSLFGMAVTDYYQKLDGSSLIKLDEPANVGDVVVIKSSLTRAQNIVNGQITYNHLSNDLKTSLDI